MTIKLIVGLGNPGASYDKTRHNVGAWVVSFLAEKNQLILRKENKFSASIASHAETNTPYYLAIPNTFMNLSGQAVQALAHFYRLKPHDILIVHDELDLPPGTARLKFSGGAGGHNGLKDIIEKLHSPDFYRLRIGIGHPGHRNEVSDYVLSRPSAEDHTKIISSIDASLAVIPYVLRGEIDKAMHQLHTN